jgi:hypothetical protein
MCIFFHVFPHTVKSDNEDFHLVSHENETQANKYRKNESYLLYLSGFIIAVAVFRKQTPFQTKHQAIYYEVFIIIRGIKTKKKQVLSTIVLMLDVITS